MTLIMTKMMLLLGIMTILGVNASAQNPHAWYSNVVLSNSGLPVPGASVFICEAGTANPAPLFTGESKGTTKTSIFVDLSLAMTDASSSFADYHSASAAFDGDAGTYWSCATYLLSPFPGAASAGEWIWINLGEDRQLASVSIDFSSCAVEYTIRLLTEAEATRI